MKLLNLFLALAVGVFFTSCKEDNAPVVPTGITVDQSGFALEIGEVKQIKAILAPEGAVGVVVWESLDAAIATVDADGLVTAVAEGETSIVASYESLSDTCLVTVVKKRPTSIVLDQTTLSISKGESKTLTATFLPEDAFGVVTWSSMDEAVVKVNNGVVTGISPGTAKVIATCNDLSAECEVTVGLHHSLQGSDYYVFLMDQITFETIEPAVTADLRVDEATSVLDIWENSYKPITCRGSNFYGVENEGWVSLMPNDAPWGGTGGGAIRQMKDFDLSKIDASYTFHCAYKTRSGGTHRICLFNPDNQPVWLPLTESAEKEWVEFELPMSVFLSQGWRVEPYIHTSAPGLNCFGFESKPSAVVLELDAVFIYKKAQ